MATGKHEQVWDAMRAALVAATAGGSALDYVASTSILEGVRENIPSGAYPVIVMEPDEEDERQHTLARHIRQTYRIALHVAIEHMDMDEQIVAADPGHGIMDIVSDVKNVLSATKDLGVANVNWIRFPSTQYSFDNYPIREATIRSEIDVSLLDTGR